MDFLINKLKLIELEFQKYHDSETYNGEFEKELNLEVYVHLKNGKQFTFVLSNFFNIDYKRQLLEFRKAHKFITISFSEIYNIGII